MSVENVRDKWENVTNMSNAKHFNSIQEVTGELMNGLSGDVESNSNEAGDKFAFNSKDLILYALGGTDRPFFVKNKK